MYQKGRDSVPLLTLEKITKDFGEGPVLKDFCLDLEQGEFLTMLGPSGCGKTTTLRIIAGLESPTEGRVLLNCTDITDWPPEKRPLNTVFQNYALFPHMNVEQNIAYGLRVRRVSRAEQKKLVAEALELVRLPGYEKRMPKQLSGGQRQRVAIARAVVLKPQLLLLDEPLGALDLKLRQEMQQELKQLHRALGITFVYITHDQEEALNMSTRVALLNNGRIEQIGTPQEVYQCPQSLFAASFIGQSNLLSGVLEQLNGNSAVLNVRGLHLPVTLPAFRTWREGEKAVLCLRPQTLTMKPVSATDGDSLMGTVLSREYIGGIQHTRIGITDSLILNAATQPVEGEELTEGQRVQIWWNPEKAPLVPDTREAVAC